MTSNTIFYTIPSYTIYLSEVSGRYCITVWKIRYRPSIFKTFVFLLFNEKGILLFILKIVLCWETCFVTKPHSITIPMMAKPRVTMLRLLSFKPKEKENATDLDLKAWLGRPAHHRRAGASSAHQGGQGGWEGLAAVDSCWFWCRATQLFHQSTGWSLCYRIDSC